MDSVVPQQFHCHGHRRLAAVVQDPLFVHCQAGVAGTGIVTGIIAGIITGVIARLVRILPGIGPRKLIGSGINHFRLHASVFLGRHLDLHGARVRIIGHPVDAARLLSDCVGEGLFPFPAQIRGLKVDRAEVDFRRVSRYRFNRHLVQWLSIIILRGGGTIFWRDSEGKCITFLIFSPFQRLCAGQGNAGASVCIDEVIWLVRPRVSGVYFLPIFTICFLLECNALDYKLIFAATSDLTVILAAGLHAGRAAVCGSIRIGAVAAVRRFSRSGSRGRISAGLGGVVLSRGRRSGNFVVRNGSGGFAPSRAAVFSVSWRLLLVGGFALPAGISLDGYFLRNLDRQTVNRLIIGNAFQGLLWLILKNVVDILSRPIKCKCCIKLGLRRLAFFCSICRHNRHRLQFIPTLIHWSGSSVLRLNLKCKCVSSLKRPPDQLFCDVDAKITCVGGIGGIR